MLGSYGQFIPADTGENMEAKKSSGKKLHSKTLKSVKPLKSGGSQHGSNS
jgi:hypothetical protein